MKQGTFTASAFLCMASVAFGQGAQYRMDDAGNWVRVQESMNDSDRASLDRARSLIAAGDFDAALEILEPWLTLNESSGNPFVAEALLLRGDAKLGNDEEYDALFDYEKVVNRFPESEMFSTALEREMDVASLYFSGRRVKTFGIRIDSGRPIGEEIVMRINERLPGSKLAERGLLELADYYYKRRDLRMASETYDVFLTLFPTSRQRLFAMQRRIFANVAQYQGPAYDANPLIEARLQIEEFETSGAGTAEKLGLGEELKTRLDESAAEQMWSVSQWYLKRSDPTSARYTMLRLVRRFPTTRAAELAFDELNSRGWMPAAPAPATTEQPDEQPKTESSGGSTK